ncbi:MAG: NAD-dependent succinate-semialdehyde dehydrogenase [Promethearchaeota archaeon]|nr:MAG: NAD-dependent succinate-semialdehyde dehydrogenase [Candidatus Lokiarchaeota archaeon]
MKSINPYNGEIIKEYQEMSLDEIGQIIEQAQESFLTWRNVSFEKKSALMKRAAKILRENSREYGKLMALEMGKPIKDGIAEAEKCGWVCDYYAENAEKFLEDEVIETDATKSYVSYQPLGVVLAVMPWNFPFWQVFRFAAPSLMAGNVGLLKHASNVFGCALAIEDVFIQAGFPKNTFRSLLVGSSNVNKIIDHPLIKAVTLTGSVPAGKAVARKAGAVLKKTVLELGGSDPYLILEDAELEKAAQICALSRLINSGQSCIAAKRFIVVEQIQDKFEEFLIKEMKKYKMGDPLDETTQIGPQSRFDLRDALHKQVTKSIEKGARCILGGEIPNNKGAFYPPTILTSVKKGMPAYEEELFGPVASIITVKNEDEAIGVANDSIFGLGASIFTKNIQKGNKIAKENIQAGCCFVNTYVRSDPRLPFGGIKESGYGRELSYHGIKEFVNIKTVYLK